MNITQYITKEIHPLSPNDPVEFAQMLFKDLTFSHIPIVSDHELIGMLSEDDVQGFESEKPVNDYRFALDHFFVRDSMLWLDVLETFAQNETTVMPVLDENDRYLGYYELSEILGVFSETPFFNEPGGIVVVEKGIKDHSFSEVSQIVESNNGRMLGAFISETRGEVVQLTIKIASSGLGEIIQTFRRYSYEIVSGVEDDLYLKDLRERSDYLNRYLNI